MSLRPRAARPARPARPARATRGVGLAALLAGAALMALDVAAAVGPPWPAALSRSVLGESCHQDPARSFELSGRSLGACARCVGLHAGAALGGLLVLLGASLGRIRPLPWLAAAAAPLLVDVALGVAVPAWDFAWLRTTTGLVAAAACVLVATAACGRSPSPAAADVAGATVS